MEMDESVFPAKLVQGQREDCRDMGPCCQSRLQVLEDETGPWDETNLGSEPGHTRQQGHGTEARGPNHQHRIQALLVIN